MKSQAQGRSLFRRVAVVAGAVTLLGAAACATQADPEPARVEVNAEAQRHHHRNPVTVMIDTARLHGDLTIEQELILDDITAELEEGRTSRHALHDKLRISAVGVVRAGTTDSEEFDSAVAEAMSAVEAHVAQQSDLLEEIHAMLDEDQRALVADELRAHIDQKFGPKPVAHKRRGDGFERFVTHLAMSTFQVDQLMAIKKELVDDTRQLRPSRDELHALVDAFEGDDFRAALDAFHEQKGKIFRAHIAQAGDRTDTVLSIFTQEQRELLADLILEGPSKVLYGEDAPDAQ